MQLTFHVGAFVERDDYSTGLFHSFKTKEVTGFISFINCNVYQIATLPVTYTRLQI